MESTMNSINTGFSPACPSLHFVPKGLMDSKVCPVDSFNTALSFSPACPSLPFVPKGLKAGSHNDTKPCVASHCIRMSIYEHCACTTHKHNARIESISILTFKAMRSANQISVTTCSMADEKLIEDVHCFPCLWQVSSKCYKDARARENTWKEVASQVTEQTKQK